MFMEMNNAHVKSQMVIYCQEKHSFSLSHATTTGLESAGKKRLNSTAPEIIGILQTGKEMAVIVVFSQDLLYLKVRKH